MQCAGIHYRQCCTTTAGNRPNPGSVFENMFLIHQGHIPNENRISSESSNGHFSVISSSSMYFTIPMPEDLTSLHVR